MQNQPTNSTNQKSGYHPGILTKEIVKNELKENILEEISAMQE